MSETFTPDSLIAGDFPRITEKVTVKTGNNLVRGTVLGKITIGAASVNTIATKGALTLDGTTPILANAQVGAYKAICTGAASNSGTFRVTDPKGNVLGDVLVGATFANQIKFAIADGGADFEVGDTFTITVAAGSGKVVAVDSTKVDGSQAPFAILGEAVDATSADKDGFAFLTGEFLGSALTFGGTDVVATHKVALRDRSIFLK